MVPDASARTSATGYLGVGSPVIDESVRAELELVGESEVIVKSSPVPPMSTVPAPGA
jgi:hypothetical protein